MSERRGALCDCVRRAVERHLRDLNGEEARGLHQKVLDEAERSLIETVLEHSGGSRVKAARALGISRNTLRKKIQQFGLDA